MCTITTIISSDVLTARIQKSEQLKKQQALKNLHRRLVDAVVMKGILTHNEARVLDVDALETCLRLVQKSFINLGDIVNSK